MSGGTLSRRDFLKGGFQGLCVLGLSPAFSLKEIVLPSKAYGKEPSETAPHLHEALHYEKKNDLKVRCVLCPRECDVADLERGYCGVRENQGGIYYTLVHSRPCTIHVDPIEKKPLFHFLPGTTAYSIATAGCNMECKFCQNWQISQFRPEQIDSFYAPPKKVVESALQKKARSIAYTYTEPVIFYEYMYDCAQLGKERGIHSVMISNGYITEKPMRALCDHLSAIKIDLKAFTEHFYKDTCSGELKPVLHTLEILRDMGIWFEIVVLLVPTLNDTEIEIRNMSKWIRRSLGADVPLHFSRYHPTYKITNIPPTPVKTLEMARNVALEEGLHYAYLGNIPGHAGEHTYCPQCHKMLIKRFGYYVTITGLKDGTCTYCNHKIAGFWKG